ncbi:N-alpha-acetyltransferase 80 [Planococcus citri]|uniref:N-alpha-acetyltransferase 80 n=1 Tax=Planococcus citri TaxID=170843 RepID=UPI0031F87603
MEVETAVVVPLHDYGKYLNVCCELINEEWPRSTSARIHSLKSSCDNLPTSLILILYDADGEIVIGHSKISPLHKMPNGCFVECVVVAKKFRGKGWGRYIMLETEKYAKSKGKAVIYLSTSDKREFYEKLGYSVCEPVSIYGGRSVLQTNNNFISSILSPDLFKSTRSSVPTSTPLPPAPPAPPPPKSNFSTSSKKVYMRKVLT